MKSSDTLKPATWYQDEDLLLGVARTVRLPKLAPSIAGYDSLKEISRGGQGVVYDAVQRSTRQRVAIKVLLAGSLATPVQQRRFEREAEMAASLRHPNIVRVFDSGMTPEGFAYLVMEFVDGRPLDDVLSEALPEESPQGAIKQRVAVLAAVCHGVAHAHQRGVIHRDLKPGNVLVDAGGPRVVDFGLAKPISGPDTIDVSKTGQFLGSLPWASPEQVEGTPDGMDVRSDVYSLGVMLYQAVTGSFPYDVRRSITTTLENIRSAQPVPPRQLSRAVDEDLQTVILKALAKDPARRYQSATELSQDLDAWLDNEPVRARRDSAWYTLRTKARRYRRVAWVAGAFAVVVSGALAWSVYAGQQLTKARDMAKEEAANATRAESFLEHMLQAPDPHNQGRDVRVADILDAGSESVDEQFKDHPLSAASAHALLARTYAALGIYDKALGHYESAEKGFVAVLGASSDEAIGAKSGRASCHYELGQIPTSIELATQAANTARAQFGPLSVRTLDCESVLASSLDAAGRLDEALPMKQSIAERTEQLKGPTDDETTSAYNNLAVAQIHASKLTDARATLQKLLDLVVKAHGEDYPDAILVTMNLASVAKDQSDFAAAEVLLKKAMDKAPRVLGPDNPDTFVTQSNYGDLLLKLSRPAEAKDVLQKTLENQRRVLGPTHRSTLGTLNNLAMAYDDLGDKENAEKSLRAATEGITQAMGRDNVQTFISTANLAAALVRFGKVEEGEQLLAEMVPRARKKLGEDHWMCGAFAANLCSAHLAAHRLDDALEAGEYSADTLRKALGPDNDRTQVAVQRLGLIHEAIEADLRAGKRRM
ncbi:MAG: serine/threonine-protein kinase [Phycisphaerales bacterium]|jgi:tetratricopeptide (TPR) repeat protein/predicted Ser/Thr protein kinase